MLIYTQNIFELCMSLQGFGVTWVRTLGLMTTYFILVDSGRRHFPDQFSKPLLGPFLTSGLSATLAWWLVWPLEYMKAQVQGNYGKYVCYNWSKLCDRCAIVSIYLSFF